MMRFVLVLSMALLSGCAFTVHDVNVNYRYQDPVALNLESQPVNVGEFSDARGVANPRMIMHMRNLNGDTTSGGWQAEKPLAEIVKDAVTQGLQKANASIEQDGRGRILTGQVEDFETEVIMGFWEGTLKGKLMVKMQMRDAVSGDLVWQDTFVGSGSVKGGEGATGLFKATLDDLVADLLGDEFFKQHIAR